MPANEQLLDYALCSPEDVQGLLAGQSYAGSSLETLTRLINLFSEVVQGPGFLNRQLAKKSYTEYFDIATECWKPLVVRYDWVQLKAPPIVVSTDDPPVPTLQIWNSSERVYNSASLLTLYDDYTVDVDRGFISSVTGYWLTGPRALKITYTGGLVDPPETNAPPSRPTAPPDLRHACAMQVAAWFQRKKELGLDTIAFPQGGALSVSDPSKLLTQVRATLSKYRVFRGVS